jgi:hypothetical protein
VKYLRWIRRTLADPSVQRGMAVAMIYGGTKWLWEDTLRRLDELEATLKLRGDLKALEDVATLADLQALERDLEGRYVPVATRGPAKDTPAAAPEAPESAQGPHEAV